MGITAAAALEEEEGEEAEEQAMPAPIRFSRSKCDWLAKLRQLQQGSKASAAKQHCSLNSSTDISVAFGLPTGDFQQSPPPSKVKVEVSPAPPPPPRRKRKQERPRSCPRDSPSEHHLLLQSEELALKRRRTDWRQQRQQLQENGSPDSGNPNPACKMQLTKRRGYGLEDCSDGENREQKPGCCSTPPTWKSCMEKMRAFSLRSDSSINSESDCPNSELQDGEEEEDDDDDDDDDGDEEQEHLEKILLSTKRRKPVEDQGPQLLQEEEKPHNENERAAVLQQQQQNGFVADFHTRAALKLPADHPACQPRDTLVYSLYQVFTKAGRTGLTAREAVSKILEHKLPGLDDGGVISARVEVVKIVRNSPYFMELEESKFVLWSAITGLEDKPKLKHQLHQLQQQQETHDWAKLAVRRARSAAKTRRKPVLNHSNNNSSGKKGVNGSRRGDEEHHQEREQEKGAPRKRRLKSFVQQDGTALGNRCNRSDGKGWHCPLRAQVGYLLCDHHLDRLRSKSGSKTRRPNRKRGRGGGAAAAAAAAAAIAAGKNELKKRSNNSSNDPAPWDSPRVARSSKRIKQRKQQRQEEEELEESDDLGGEQEEEQDEEVITTTFGLV